MLLDSQAAANGQPEGQSPLAGELPRPQRPRWQPLRSGLINLFHFADEQFWFEDGRLLLRGNNGTGKSRVLALQLPFLLDAELSPTRMEPDRSPSKRPEWNLLLAGKHRDRLGYTWIEFGRLDDAGQPHYLTLGCGLHAVEHRGAPDAWFFMTPLRIGEQLELVVDSVPLTRPRLAEALGDAGQLFRTQGDYRRAVDERLFHLGGRYRPLIDLLIQLRVPQLSRDFDEARMSAQLSGALPPLSVDILAQVADAMRDLDDERERLEQLRHCQRGAAQFSDDYRRYLQIALKRRAIDLSQQHNRYERVQRTMNDHRRVLEETQQKTQLVERKRAATRDEIVQARAALEALKSRPEVQDAHRISDLRSDCEHLRRTVAERRTDEERAAAQQQGVAARLQEQTATFENQQLATRQRIDEIARVPAPQQLTAAFAKAARGLIDSDDAAGVLDATQAAVGQCRAGAEQLKEHQRRIDAQQQEVKRESDRQNDLEQQRDEAQGTLAQETQRLEETRRQLCAALITWHDQSVSLRSSLPPRAQWLELLEPTDEEAGGDARETVGGGGEELERLDANPLRAVRPLFFQARDRTLESLTLRRSALQQSLDERAEEMAALARQRQALVDGVHQPPPAPYTRGEAVRSQRDGAPLYELCEFVDDVPAEERPRWEAALEASGLLDAWLTPDGRLHGDPLHDTSLLAGEPVADADRRLSRVLRPAGTLPAGMSPEVVIRLLDSVGCGRSSAAAWVDRDGCWQLGPATGCWAKEEVQHLGAAAREQRRQRQIQELTAAIEDLERQQGEAQSQLEGLDQQRIAVQEEVDQFPEETPYLQAAASRVAAAAQLAAVADRLEEQLRRIGEARKELWVRQGRRDRDAEDLQLAEWIERLDPLTETLTAFAFELRNLQRDLEGLQQLRSALDQLQAEATIAEQWVERTKHQRVQANENWLTKQSQLQTLEATVGAKAEEILARIAEEERREKTLESQSETLQKELVEVAQQAGELQGKLSESQQMLEAYETDREAAVERLGGMFDQGLVGEALPELAEAAEFSSRPWSPTRAAAFAKAVRQELQGTAESEERWERSQNEILERFGKLEHVLLPAGNTPQMQTHGDVMVVTIPYRGSVCAPGQLAREMADDVRHRETLITERERELFEQRLIGDIAESLHRNIRNAHQLCNQMNAEVQSRPMSTGMRLRFQWRALSDGPEELKAACQTLLRKPAAMSSEDRAGLGRFLQQRIQEARARDDAGTWQQHLEEALDYRNWFAFDIERETDGRWQRLTKRTHGTGSGGERAVALIIPMLAALAAYYRSASEQAPRVILMDEAFVGIDNEMRAKFMDLLVQFDLDFVMTSEREWGCYSTMPALAIYHLSTRRGIDAILSTRWVWNGNGRQISDVHEPARQQTMFESIPGGSDD